MSELSKDVANEVASHMVFKSKVDNAVAFDPLTVLAIIGVIIQIAKLIAECRNKSTALDSMVNPSYTQRVRLWLMLNRKFRGKDDKFIDSVYEGIREAAKSKTFEQVKMMSQEKPPEIQLK
jgi:hypothetical protein